MGKAPYRSQNNAGQSDSFKSISRHYSRHCINSLTVEKRDPRARSIVVDDKSLTEDLMDGRTIIVPLVWYPRLWHRTSEKRKHLEIFGDRTDIDSLAQLDQNLTVAGLLAGLSSAEIPQSFKIWMEARGQKKYKSM